MILDLQINGPKPNASLNVECLPKDLKTLLWCVLTLCGASSEAPIDPSETSGMALGIRCLNLILLLRKSLTQSTLADGKELLSMAEGVIVELEKLEGPTMSLPCFMTLDKATILSHLKLLCLRNRIKFCLNDQELRKEILGMTKDSSALPIELLLLQSKAHLLDRENLAGLPALTEVFISIGNRVSPKEELVKKTPLLVQCQYEALVDPEVCFSTVKTDLNG